MVIATDAEILELALRLDELDHKIIKAGSRADFDGLMSLIPTFIKVKLDLHRCILDRPTIQIFNEKAKTVIKKISLDEDLSTDKLIKWINNKYGEEGKRGEKDVEELFDDYDELWNAGQDLLGSWFSSWEYLQGLYELGRLVSGSSIPKQLETFIEECRSCYAFQQYLAVYAICRTILEVSIRDLGQRKGFLPKDRGKVKHDILRRFADMKHKVVPKHLKDEVSLIYDRTSGLIHGTKIVEKKDARDMFQRTISTIQQLYEHYHLG